MTKALVAILLVAGFSFTSCKNETKTEETKKTEQNSSVTYQYDPSSTTVAWTAYKYSDKVGVNGTFNEFTVVNTSDGATPQEVLKNASIELKIGSSASGDAGRDATLSIAFFGKLRDKETITAKITELKEDNTGVIELGFNGLKRDLPITYSVEGNTFSLEGVVDLPDWEANDAYNSIHETCLVLHTGEDGKSVTWPDVKIKASTVLKRL